MKLKAEDAIYHYHEYFMLLGITEFTKVYLQIKDNPWPFVNLVSQISGFGTDMNPYTYHVIMSKAVNSTAE
jgi:hypothetical protein